MNQEELQQYILNNFFVNNKFNGMKFKKISQEIKNTIEQKILKTDKNQKDHIQRCIYLILNNYEQEPKCLICDNTSNFISLNKGYGKYCSSKCTANRDKNTDIIKEKDYSIISKNKFYELKSKQEIINFCLDNKIITVTNTINSNISLQDVALLNISIYKSILYYTKNINGLLNQKLYHIFNNIEYLPKCKCCETLVSFITFTAGYKTYCSDKCSANDIDIITKRNNTLKERYGEDYFVKWNTKAKLEYYNKTGYVHNTHNPLDKEKRNNTLIKKYGEDWGKILTNKASETYFNKTGYKNPFKNPEVIDKCMESLKDRRFEIGKKSAETRKRNYSLHNPCIGNMTNLEYIYDREYLIQNFIFSNGTVNINKLTSFFNCAKSWAFHILKTNNIDYMKSKSKLETEISEYIKSLGIENILINDRNIIKPLELDILIPCKNLAIELNGLMFHSYGKHAKDIFNNHTEENKNYHLNKTQLCEEKGIQLFHIFENEWVEKQDICKSMIKEKLKLIDNKIYARKCIIKEVDKKDSDLFLTKNHLQGKDTSSIRLGLYYNDELVSLMTLGKSRFNKNYDYELIRFCSKLNTSVIGGASKLLKYFKDNYGNSIISYANRRWSQGNLYKKLGFTFLYNSKPNYFYLDKKLNVYSRQQFQKHKLKDKLEVYDESLSESENMFNNGYRRIWDCGNKVYIL